MQSKTKSSIVTLQRLAEQFQRILKFESCRKSLEAPRVFGAENQPQSICGTFRPELFLLPAGLLLKKSAP